MKKASHWLWTIVWVVGLCLAIPGCWLNGPTESSDSNVSDKTVIHLGRYINDKLPTSTPAEDKAEIKALYAEINALDASLRGTAANQATQALIAGKAPAATTAPATKGK